jgi:apolipoprotein N-acyltransferase
MTRIHGAARTAVAVLLSGTMWFLSSGINHVWFLAWLAPLPLLVVLINLRLLPAMVAAFTASAIGAFSWLVAYGPLSFVLVFMVAVPYTLVALFWRAIARRTNAVIAAISYPALAVSAEFLLSRVSPHGTLGSLAYSQGDVPVILQIASFTGLWGISFLLALLPAALAIAWARRAESRLARTLLLTGTLPVVAAIIFGEWRLATPGPSAEVAVGLAASDVETARRREQGPPGDPVPTLRAFADRAVKLASRGAKIIVLPEKFVTVTREYAEPARTILSATARERQVTIVAGWYVDTGSEPRNVAIVFGPDGDVLLEYDKQHLIPGIEWGYRAGSAIGLLPEEPVRTGVAICKDMDFVPLGRAYARAGVGLLLVPAWDFIRDRWLHSRMAILRGVEGGYAIARTATDGLLTVSDARGRIVTERASGESADVLLNAVVRVGSGGTFYSRTGDWFAWLCLLTGTAGIAAAAIQRHSRRTIASPIVKAGR